MHKKRHQMALVFGRSSHSSEQRVARVGALWHVFMKICTQIRINSIPHEIDSCMTIISSYTLNTENNLSLNISIIIASIIIK